MKAGAYAPNRPEVTLYAMSGDDIPMYFDMNNLTPKQQADHAVNVDLLGHQQVSLMAISKPEDYVAVYDDFRRPPYAALLQRFHELQSSLGLPMVPLDHLVYAPKDSYYEAAAAKLPPVAMINLLMVSPSNRALHTDEAGIERNLKLNSKFHFAEHAAGFGIPTPETLITAQPLTGNPEAEAFFTRHGGQVMLKMTGFAGGRNVASVENCSAGDRYLADYDDAAPVILQQKIPLQRFQEWTIDLHITDREISVDNVRRIMLADGLWIGNLHHVDYPLTPEQEAILINVGEYARSFGFGSADGNNFGIDFFKGPDGEIVVTEINPRWTAGLFSSELLKRLQVDRDAVAYYDLVAKDRCLEYLDYVESRLPGRSSTAFEIVPLGFMPFDVDVAGQPFVSVWSIVIGDFPAYRSEAKQRFGPQAFPNADKVPL
ncbi:MAG: hypothetical protein JJT88_02640 [Gammaproteobacteria bacterium]|nr:hypothetical protein [Gammaproteobacteria bacterium]